MAIWTKFPHARFFVHYAAGCTMIESFYQSVRCPLQLLIVGDPLACPWAVRGTVMTQGFPERLVGEVEVQPRAQDAAAGVYGDFDFLVDGRPAGSGSRITLRPQMLAPGRHSLRVVARRAGLVRNQLFCDNEFEVPEGRD
jgi:hypothetical protein